VLPSRVSVVRLGLGSL